MIDRKTLKDLRKDIDAELSKLGKKYNMVISAGNCSFSEGHNATFKLNCADITPSGFVTTKEVTKFKANVWDHGLPVSLLGKCVDNKVFLGMGSGYKYSFVYENKKNNKRYKATKANIVHLFKV